ncbi:hypothetical protein FRC01_014728 [Tulasnella sp. 417]|nr:hypothetical protein FRC01_014728 [Tulasnella sp. 417]
MINLRSELQSSGVSLTDCPRASNRKDVVDKMLLVDMLAFAMDNPAPAVIVLISGDRDFVYAVSVLRHRKYDVVLIIPPQGAHITLQSQATVVLDWRFDIFREDNPVLNGSTADSASTSSNPGAVTWNRSSLNDLGKPNPASPHRKLSQARSATPDTEALSLDAGAAMIFGSAVAEPLSTPPPRNPSSSEAHRTPMSGGIPPEVIDVGETLPPPPVSPTFYFSPRVKRATPDVPPTASSSGAGSSSSASLRPTTDPMRMFSNLIEVLEEWRLMGNEKPLQSKLQAELVKKNPLLYRRVAVKNFTEYISLAEKSGVVKTGAADTPGLEWIALTDAFKGKIFPVM